MKCTVHATRKIKSSIKQKVSERDLNKEKPASATALNKEKIQPTCDLSQSAQPFPV
jgi:hypothetical protein